MPNTESMCGNAPVDFLDILTHWAGGGDKNCNRFTFFDPGKGYAAIYFQRTI